MKFRAKPLAAAIRFALHGDEETRRMLTAMQSIWNNRVIL